MKLLFFSLAIFTVTLFTIAPTRSAFAFDKYEKVVLWSKYLPVVSDAKALTCKQKYLGVLERDQPAMYDLTITVHSPHPEIPELNKFQVSQTYSTCESALLEPFRFQVAKVRTFQTLSSSCFRGVCGCETSEYYEIGEWDTWSPWAISNTFNRVSYPRGACPQN